MRPALPLALLLAACASNPPTADKGATDGADGGTDGADGADGGGDGADGTSAAHSVAGTVTCGACTGEVVVAVFPEGDFDPETTFGVPVADLRLDGPGEFVVPLADAGDYWVMAWGEEEPNGGPDPFEPIGLSDGVVAVSGDVAGIDLTLTVPVSYGNPPDCDAHALDTVVWAAPISAPPETITVDGVFDEWGDLDPVLSDPTADVDDCGAGGADGTDILALHLTQDTGRTAFALELAAPPSPGAVYSVVLRQLDPNGHGPWGAGELELLVEHIDGDWQGAVVVTPLTTPEPVHFFSVGAGEDGLEGELEWGFTGDLTGYRARAFAGPDGAGDETAFVELGHSGIADADGGPVPLSGGALLVDVGTAEADLVSMVGAFPEVALEAYDTELGLAEIAFDLPLDGTWAGAVEVSERIDAIVAGLEADGAVGGFLPHTNRQTHAQVLWNTDMAAWTGHSADIVNWAMNTIQAEHAQQLFVDCYPRVSSSADDVDVLVVDANLNEAYDARTRFDTEDFFFGEVTMGSSIRRAAWEAGEFAGTSWPHGLATSALIAKRSTSSYEGRGEITTSGSGDARVGDRMSGILTFGGIDGSFEPGSQDFEFPLNLGLWATDWGGVAGTGWLPSTRGALASGSWDVMNASWGELAQGRYCVRSNCEWNFGPNGSCVCDGMPAAANACGGWQRHNVTAAQARAFGQGAKRIWAANRDTLFVVSSGNDCLDLDDSGGVSAWAEVDETDTNVLLVGGLIPARDPDDVVAPPGANTGDHVGIAAPYYTLTWKPGIYYYKDADSDASLERLVWDYERGVDQTYRWAAGTSYSAPMTTAVAAMAKAVVPDATPAWLRQTLIDGSEPSGVTDAPRLLNAPRVVARAVDQALTNESATHILSLRSESFSASCATLSEGESMGSRMDVECALMEVDGAGAVTGTGQLMAGDAESAHTLEGTLDLSNPGGGGSTFTLRGTDWMPGPGALPSDTQDHAWTVFEGVTLTQVGEDAKGTAVWLLAGTFRGDAELYEDTSGETQADCTWTGTFSGTLIETSHTGW